jgi:large subunit ribosomal protein L17
MRHGKKVKKLGRTQSHRKAMLANMAASLLIHNIIRTTEAKAKEVRKLAEKLITLGKRGDLHAHRQVYAVIKDRKLVKRIFDEIAPKFKEREGGYTRVLRLGIRKGDGATLAVVELLLEKAPTEEKKGKKDKATKKAKPEKTKEPKAKGVKKEKAKAKPAQTRGAGKEKVERTKSDAAEEEQTEPQDTKTKNQEKDS